MISISNFHILYKKQKMPLSLKMSFFFFLANQIKVNTLALDVQVISACYFLKYPEILFPHSSCHYTQFGYFTFQISVFSPLRAFLSCLKWVERKREKKGDVTYFRLNVMTVVGLFGCCQSNLTKSHPHF